MRKRKVTDQPNTHHIRKNTHIHTQLKSWMPTSVNTKAKLKHSIKKPGVIMISMDNGH